MIPAGEKTREKIFLKNLFSEKKIFFAGKKRQHCIPKKKHDLKFLKYGRKKKRNREYQKMSNGQTLHAPFHHNRIGSAMAARPNGFRRARSSL